MAACYSKLTLLHGGMTTANEVRTIGCTSPGFSCLYYMYSHDSWSVPSWMCKVCAWHIQSRNSAGKYVLKADLFLEYTESWYAWVVSIRSYTSGQLHEIKECVGSPVNTVYLPVYILLACLGIVNCRIRPTKRATKGAKKIHIPVVVTVLRPPEPPWLNNNRIQPCRLTRVSICDCGRLNACLINCQSICNNAIIMKHCIVDIILLFETWLS